MDAMRSMARRAAWCVAVCLVLGGCGRSDERTGLSARREALVLKGTEVCSAVLLTNHGPGELKLGQVLLNGEQAAVPAEESSQRYGPSGKPMPDRLDAGQSVLLFHRDMETRPAENYTRDLTFLLVDTGTGQTRVPVETPAGP